MREALYSIYIIALISLANTVYPIPRIDKKIKSTGIHMIDVKSKNMNDANLTMDYSPATFWQALPITVPAARALSPSFAK